MTACRNRPIGFVFQFHNLLPDFTALENVLFPTAVQAGRETAVARALVNRPQLVLADKPSAISTAPPRCR